MWPTVASRAPVAALQYKSRAWFGWRVADLSLTARSGQIGTLTRAGSSATTIDRWGRIVTVPDGMPRYVAVDTGSGNRDDLALAVEQSSTNKCVRSDDLTQWTNNGLVRTANAITHGELSLTLLQDDSGSVAESCYSTVSMTQTYATVSAYLAPGVSAASGTTIRLRDQTAGTTRGGVLVTWTDGMPTVTSVSGASVGRDYLGAGIWRVWATIASGIITGNTNRVEVIPATTSSHTGSIYVGGVQVENLRVPTSLIRTAGAAVTRSEDVLTWPLDARWRDGFSVLLDVVTPPETGYAGTVDVAGGVTVLGNVRVARGTTSRTWNAYPTSTMSDGAAAAWSAGVALGSTQRVAAQFDGYVRGGRTARIDTGGGWSGWTATAAGVVAPGSTLTAYADTTASSNLLLRGLVVVPGLLDRSDLLSLW